MRFFVTLIFLTLQIIRYGCELTLAQLPITAEMTGSTGVGKCSCQQERYKRGASTFEEEQSSKQGPRSKQKDFQQDLPPQEDPSDRFSTADRFSARESPARPFSARETARPDSTDLFTRPPSYRHKNGSCTRTALRQSHRQLRHRNLSSYPYSFFSTEPFSSFSKAF